MAIAGGELCVFRQRHRLKPIPVMPKKLQLQFFYKIIIVLASIATIGSIFFLIIDVYAHPGRTASDGCHYCRTNCDYWGVPWNTRHCHNGYVPPQTEQTIEEIPVVEQGKIGLGLEERTPFPVVEITDGDTIKIKDDNGDIEKVRIIGIDTPETVHPSKPVECFGKEASNKT